MRRAPRPPAEWFQAEPGGPRLSVQRTGSGGPPVVLLHGLSGSAHWWRDNVPALAEGHDVYLLELAGFGRAWRDRALSVTDAAHLIGAWLDARDLHDVTLIGHSMGGQISALVAAQHPERVRNLVLACASGLLESSVQRAALNLPRALATGRKSFVPRILADGLRAGPRNLWLSSRSLLTGGLQEVLPTLKARTLVVWGGRDALVPVQLGRRMSAAIPGATHVEFDRAGHVVMVDAAEDFNRAVLDFLRHDEQKERLNAGDASS